MLNRHNLQLVGEFADTRESRYTLTSIQVQAKETIATNGHYLVRVTRPQLENMTELEADGVCPFLMDGKQAKDIGKAIGKGPSANVSLNGDGVEGGRAVKLADGTVFHAAKVDGTFPNVDAVMPTGEPVMVIGFDPDYLAKLGKAFATFQGEQRQGSRMVKVSLYAPDKAIKMEATNDAGQVMTAVLMPRRV